MSAFNIPIVPVLMFGLLMLQPKSIQEQAQRIVAGALLKESTGCLETTVCKDGGGYGMITSLGKGYRAHVAVWIAKRGKIPKGQKVLHDCDNPSCVNIEHLHLGTQAKNAQEMVQRGRQAGAIRQKLSVSDVEEIRLRRASGESQGSLARAFDVQPNTISRILSNKRWGHLGLEEQPHFFAHQKLSDDDVRSIRRLSANGEKQRDIAKRFNVLDNMISRILSGKRRADVI